MATTVESSERKTLSREKSKGEMKTGGHGGSMEMGARAVSFTPDVAQSFLSAGIDHAAELVANVLGVNEAHVNLVQSIQVDYYVHALEWSRQQKLSPQQTSAVLNVFRSILDNFKEHPDDSLADHIRTFKNTVSAVTDNGSAGSLLTLVHAKKLCDFVFQTIFQHTKLFKLVFSEQRHEERLTLNLSIETPKAWSEPYPYPLEEALPDWLYHTCVLSSPPNTPREPENEEEKRAAAAEEERLRQLLENVEPKELGRLIHEVTKDMLEGFEAEIIKSIKEKETEMLSKLTKKK